MGIFRGAIVPVGVILGENFPRWEFSGWNSPVGIIWVVIFRVEVFLVPFRKSRKMYNKKSAVESIFSKVAGCRLQAINLQIATCEIGKYFNFGNFKGQSIF